MTPRQLRYFVEIARSGNLTRAALSLHIAQPALSHHLAAMESALGVTLVERHARGVRLTVEGQRLFDRATAILGQLDRLGEEVRDASHLPRGEVRLCLAGSAAPRLVIPLYRLLEARAPEVRLQISTGLSREAQALVETRRVDLALLPTAFELTRLEALPVFDEAFYLFGHRRLLKGRAATIAFDAIGDRPLVAPDRDHDLRKLVERTAVARRCFLNVRYELNSPELLREVVREGLACAIMPRNAFPAGDLAELSVRRIVDPVLERTQSIVSLMDHPLTPAGEAVRSALLDLIRSLIGDGTLKARLPR